MKRKSKKIFAIFVYFVIFVFVLSIGASFIAYFFPAQQSTKSINITNWNDYKNTKIESKDNDNYQKLDLNLNISGFNLSGNNLTWNKK